MGRRMILDPILYLFRSKAVTIPPMDGAFRPNTALDDADAVLEMEAPDNLAFDGTHLLFSSRNDVLSLAPGSGTPERVEHLPATVTAMAAGPERALAIACDDGSIVIDGGKHADKRLTPASLGDLACPTALAFDGADHLLVAQGSARHRATDCLAVVVISSYLPEIMNLSDRILVCRQGRIVEELSPQEATEEKIMYAAVH